MSRNLLRARAAAEASREFTRRDQAELDAERVKAVSDGVVAPAYMPRTISGRRSGAFTVFMSFAVTQETFDSVGAYLDRRVAEHNAEKVRKALASSPPHVTPYVPLD